MCSIRKGENKTENNIVLRHLPDPITYVVQILKSFNEVVSSYYSFIVGDSQIKDNRPFQ